MELLKKIEDLSEIISGKDKAFQKLQEKVKILEEAFKNKNVSKEIVGIEMVEKVIIVTKTVEKIQEI